MEQFAYRNLIAYQKGKEVVMQTYRLLKKFPREEQYALCDQLRRASTSITSNIAEGITRHSSKDRSHFLEISYGSLMEVSSQMDVACDLGYIKSEELKETDSLVDETARLISGLQRSCSERVKSEGRRDNGTICL